MSGKMNPKQNNTAIRRRTDAQGDMMKLQWLVLFAVLGSLAGVVHAEEHLVPGWHAGSIRHDGLDRHFRYYLPDALPEKPPLVILLHGGTQSMTKIFRKHAGATRAWPRLADDADFILLTPNGTNTRTGNAKGNRQNWNDCRSTVSGSGAGSTADDVGFIERLIDSMASDFDVDRGRVYATGASNGGLMSYRLATESGGNIAAIAAFVANRPEQNECRQVATPVPVMIVNATGDRMMPWAGGEVMGGGGRVLSTQATLQYWLKRNRVLTDSAQSEQLPDLNRRDSSTVTRTSYKAKADGAEVLFYEVTGGGHNMPHPDYIVPRFLQRSIIGNQNRDFDSVRAAWEFLSRHRLPTGEIN